MKDIIYCYKYLLLLGICVFILGCGPDYNYSTQHTPQPPSQVPSKNTENLNYAIINQVQNRYSGKTRSEWQRPYKVLQMLGDLSERTIADIGAGPEGYFTLFLATNTNTQKVLALDIDQEALDFINKAKKGLNETAQNRIETRLVAPNDPKLKTEEVDAILISETLIYFDDPIGYLASLKKNLKKGGKILIIDFKMKRIPAIFPPVEQRTPLYQMENMLEQAGFQLLKSDDTSLPFHYMVLGEKI